jgi:hypothetical protein
LGFMIIFVFLCIPFSMLVSIWKMWSKYIKEEYSKMRLFCSLPLFSICYFVKHHHSNSFETLVRGAKTVQ